jgi:hypothetical protein
MMDSFRVSGNNNYLGPRDELRVAYKRGYDHGVWMHCEEPKAFAERFHKAVKEVNDEANSIWNDTHGVYEAPA